jgi:protein gp37
MKCIRCNSLVTHLHPERMDQPLHIKKPSRFLVCFTGDWMGPWVEEIHIQRALQIMRQCPRHTFLTLTKQSHRLAEFSPFPDNCWVGISVTSDQGINIAQDYLEHIEARTKYLSVEPLLNWNTNEGAIRLGGIQWLIIGGVTKCPELPQPKISWISEIVKAADQAGVKVWLKNSLKPLMITEKGHGLVSAALLDRDFETGKWKLRQEMPDGR